METLEVFKAKDEVQLAGGNHMWKGTRTCRKS